MKNKKKGFTLVELLVVIAILAVLASVSVVGYIGFTKKANESACLQEAKQAQTTIVAALIDGEEKDSTGAKVFTLIDGVLTGEAANIKDVFGLTELKGDFGLNATTKEFTYTYKGYKATFNLNGSEVTVAPSTVA